MPYEFSIDSDHNLIRERYSGTVTIDDLRGCSLDEWADPAYRKGMNILSDFRGVNYVVTQEEMRAFASLLATGGAIGRQAIVVSTTLGMGLARMFELTAASSYYVWDKARVFTDVAEAERWILGGD
jgi:hypothetical protein